MGKRQNIIRTATALFARQGFNGTTTAQIALEGNFTEPLLYYHFKGKDDLFTRIIDATFTEYFARIDELEKSPDSPFGQIQKLIELQYDIAEEMPDEVQLIANFTQLNIAKRSHSKWDSTGARPARLNDPEDICAGNVKEYRRRLLGYLTRSLSEGAKSGRFEQVPAEETAIMILSVINGIVRYQGVSQDTQMNLRSAAVEFCRRSLMKIVKTETRSAA